MFTREEIEKRWHSIQPRNGWDFSRLRAERAPAPWQYEQVVLEQRPEGGGRVLDIGTGGGEKLLSMAHALHHAIGVDADSEVVAAARANLAESSTTNVVFEIGTAESTGVDDGSIDIALNRHSVINIEEIQRVLRPDGVFVTQQVGSNNLFELLRPFGGQMFEDVDTRSSVERALEHAGFSIERSEEYDVEYTFLDIDSALFQIKAISDYLAEEPTINSLLQMVESTHNDREQFTTNEHRWLIVARKVD